MTKSVSVLGSKLYKHNLVLGSLEFSGRQRNGPGGSFFFSYIYGKALSGCSIESTVTDTQQSCAIFCISQLFCAGFNYETGSRNCQLLTSDEVSVNLFRNDSLSVFAKIIST